MKKETFLDFFKELLQQYFEMEELVSETFNSLGLPNPKLMEVSSKCESLIVKNIELDPSLKTVVIKHETEKVYEKYSKAENKAKEETKVISNILLRPSEKKSKEYKAKLKEANNYLREQRLEPQNFVKYKNRSASKIQVKKRKVYPESFSLFDRDTLFAYLKKIAKEKHLPRPKRGDFDKKLKTVPCITAAGRVGSLYIPQAAHLIYPELIPFFEKFSSKKQISSLVDEFP